MIELVSVGIIYDYEVVKFRNFMMMFDFTSIETQDLVSCVLIHIEGDFSDFIIRIVVKSPLLFPFKQL